MLIDGLSCPLSVPSLNAATGTAGNTGAEVSTAPDVFAEMLEEAAASAESRSCGTSDEPAEDEQAPVIVPITAFWMPQVFDDDVASLPEKTIGLGLGPETTEATHHDANDDGIDVKDDIADAADVAGAAGIVPELVIAPTPVLVDRADAVAPQEPADPSMDAPRTNPPLEITAFSYRPVVPPSSSPREGKEVGGQSSPPSIDSPKTTPAAANGFESEGTFDAIVASAPSDRPTVDSQVTVQVAKAEEGSATPADGKWHEASAQTRIAAEPSGEPAATDHQERKGEHHGQQSRSFGEWFREQPAPVIAGGPRPAPAYGLATSAGNLQLPEISAQAALSPLSSQISGDPLASVQERDLIGQLVQSLRVQFRDGIGEAVVKLKPEHLGEVSISVRVENGGIRATVQAEVPAVRQWIESHQETLRSGLEEHGLRLEEFVVDPETRREASSEDARDRRPRERRPVRRPARVDEPVFEVVV